MLQERFLDNARVRKFIRQRAGTFRFFREQILNDARMSPAEQAVEVAELLVKIVVTLRPDRDDIDGGAGCRPDDFRERPDPRIGSDSLAVLDAGIEKRPRHRVIHVNSGNDERTEEIAFPAFIDAEMRLEHFWRMDLLVAELRLFQDFRLELELDELLNPPSLKQKLGTLLVNRDAQLVFLREEKRVRLRREDEAEIVQQGTQLGGLVR